VVCTHQASTPRSRAFGCKGSGGSVAFADPAHEVAIAFTHNRMAAPPEDLAASITGYVRDALRETT
jgi:CubicO group peptidase (beta-lactamase class C family)